MSDASKAISSIQQISEDAALLHRFCHGGDSESVDLGGVATPTVHAFLSTWVQFLHSVTIAGESFAPSLEQGYFNTTSGSASSSSETAWLRTAGYCPVHAGRVYAVDFKDLTAASEQDPIRVDIHFYDSEKTWLSCISNSIFFAAPSEAAFVRLNFNFSSAVSVGQSPVVIVKDVVAGTRSTGGASGKRAVSLNWHDGFVHWSEPVSPTRNYGGNENTKYALLFVSKGDLVWLKAGQSYRQSIIACINSSGEIENKVVNNGTRRDYWGDHMWIADQDTCAVLSANVAYIASPECIVYPNFLYNSDTFSDAASVKQSGYVDPETGFCSVDMEDFDPAGTGMIYASSQMICLKKGQHISVAAGASVAAAVIAVYNESCLIDSEESVLGYAENMQIDMQFYGYRCTSDDFRFVRICGRLREDDGTGVPKFLSYKVANDTELSGKSLAMIGDSYVGPYQATSYPRAAYNLGMDYTSYGINGNTVSAYQENGMVNRYSQMADGFDYVGLVGGRNDYNNRANVPIGELDSTDTSTFCGALNVLCEGLIKKFIGKKLFAVTSWNVNDGQNAFNDAFVAVVSGRWNIPVLQTYKGVNVFVKVAEFRQAYCLADNDVSHLNILGHMNLMAPVIEAFIKTL